MSEFDPSKREHINLSPLERFRFDVREVQGFADLYIIMSRYLTDEFNINDSYVDRMFEADGGILPTAEMFENDARLAREQAWLMLIKLALPVAENMIENDDSFTEWTRNTVDSVIASCSPTHEIEICMKNSPGSGSHNCAASNQCPIKFTAFRLIAEAVHADMSGLDYHSDWIESKKTRTLSKIEIARDFGMFEAGIAESMARTYIRRCYLPNKDTTN